MTKFFTPLIFIMCMSACSKNPVQQNLIPDWIYHHDQGVVASCGFNIGGHYKQQECATLRARERLAAEQGVEISSVSVLSEKMLNEHEIVGLNKITEQQVKNKTVRARVKDTYYDAQRDEYYVWLVEK